MNNEKRVRYACYFTNISMSVVGNLPAILFLTFRRLYGLSYSLMGSLVLINFFTQLIVDLIFSFFSHKINISKAVKRIPIITIVGLLIYGLVPVFFKDFAVLGIIVGTVIFSAGSGFAEVLISPVIAALPSDNPEREMSKLHSIYAWGVVGVVIVSTLFLLLVKNVNWYLLPLVFSIIPLISLILFIKTSLPKIQTPEKTSGIIALIKNPTLWLFFIAMFLGGASELIMAQWASSYLEQALSIPKVWGDIFGVATFAVMLGLGRTLYAKFGKNIEKVLLLSCIGATVCYLSASLINLPIAGLIACGLTGFCVAMLWPGTLIAASSRITTGGVFVYAMMAAGGDFGASAGPQVVGIITDLASESGACLSLANSLGLTIEQLSIKVGLLVGSLFPLIAILVYSLIYKSRKNSKVSV